MKIGILVPGFSAHQDDWAIPVHQNFVCELAKGNDVARDDVRVISTRYPHHSTPYRLDGADVYPLGVGQVRGVGRLKLWWDTLRLIGRLHQEQPFDVLTAMSADECGLIAAWAGRWLEIPVVTVIFGGELAGLREIGYGLQLSRFSRWIVGQALGGADRVIAPSGYVRRLIGEAGYQVPEQKIVALTPGVDTERFTPAADPVDARHLIHVASLVPVKDQVTLLHALALLESDVTLDVIGVGTEREKLERLARELGISERVNFVGAVTHPDLPGYYQRAAIHVLSSRHETIAMTVLEAAACGVPTVSTNVGIAPDYAALGVTVPVGDTPALAQAIQALMDDPERRAALGKTAREAVERELDIRLTAERLRGIYREVTGTA